MEIFIDNFIEQFLILLRTYEGILSVIAVIPLAALAFYVISFIPVQILNFLKFRRRIKEFEAFKITVVESFKQHYEVLEQLQSFLKQRTPSSKNFTQGKIPLSQEISTKHWQLYESDFAEAVKVASVAVKKYPSLRTYPQFLSLQKRLDEQRTHLQAMEKSYNLMVYNYNTVRRGAIFTFLFALLTFKKAKKSISLKETAPNTLLNEEPKQDIRFNFPPLKTNAEFRTFYDNVLIHKIQPLETLRKEYVQQIQKTMFMVIPIAAVLTWLLIIFNEEANENPWGALITPIIIIAIILSRKIKTIKNKRVNYENQEFSNYETAFQNQIITPIINFVSDKLDYNQRFISDSMFTASGLFPTPDEYSSFYGLHGIIENRQFIFSKIQTQKNASEHIERSKSYTLQFSGLFYTADFNKNLKEAIYLLPTSLVTWDFEKQHARKGVSAHQYRIYKDNTAINFQEDVDFNKYFSVFSKDMVQTYCLLTPPLRRFFIEIQQQFKGKKIYASFIQGQFYLAIAGGDFDFKPSLMKTLLNYDNIEKHFEHIRWVLEISQDFKKVMQ